MLENRNSADSRTIVYRPDLDGLRAIAVCAVIAFHLSRHVLPGGYLGVDIFFVLSGYLITSIIWRELSHGDFSLATFYNRRIRRILPGLLLVILVTGIASCFVLLPLDLIGFARSVLASLGFVANVYFWRDTDYFSQLAEQKPLLHIWTLGVEEQFYLLFPLLLLALSRMVPRAIFGVIAVLVGISLAADVLALRAGAALPAFYLLPTRAWELGVGALLALKPAGPGPGRWATPAGLAGICAIALALGRPGISGPLVPDGVIAVLGTALLVWSGQGPSGIVHRALAWRPIVFIGLISYSLYLWHWPVIVLLKYYLIRELTPVESLLAVAGMLVAATLSWRFVERPFRSRSMPIRRVHGAVIGGALLAGSLAATVLIADGLPQRLDAAAARMNEAVGTNFRCGMTDYVYFAQSRGCALELPSRDPDDADIVLFGNSHAQMYAPLVARIAAQASQQVLLVPMNRCTPTLGDNISPTCQALAQRNVESIAGLRSAKIVILATTWGNAQTRDQLLRGLDATVARLASAGKRVILVGPIVTPNWSVASIASRSLAFGRNLERPLAADRATFDAEFAGALRHFAGRGDVSLVLPHESQCDEQQCHFVADGRALFSDTTHLAQGELERFRPAFEPALRQAIAEGRTGG